MFKHLMVATALFSSFSAFAADQNVDTAASKLVYVGKKVASSHTGEIKLQSGVLKFDDKKNLTGGEFVIDMNSITNTDIENPEYNQKFLGHIKSDDFFSTDKFKTSSLKITKVEKSKTNNYKVTADLTIKGKTAPVTFDTVIASNTATAKVVFDRTKYGVQYSSGQFFQNLGDKLILDEVELNVSLKLAK